MQTHVGELFHIQENILGGALAKYSYLTNPKEQTTDYLDRICKSFVMTSIDLFPDAEKAGSLDAFFADRRDAFVKVTPNVQEWKVAAD